MLQQQEHFGEPPKDLINFRSTCFTCSDQPGKVIQAFKMACLTYRPGRVQYNGQEVSRDVLIGVSSDILTLLEKNREESANLLKSISSSLLSKNAKFQVAYDDKMKTDIITDEVRFYSSELTENDKQIL